MILGEPIEELPGRLFIVEGIDGSGKSTQIDLLHKWLKAQGYLVVFSEWNSSPIVAATTRRGKKRHLLTPMSFSLIHAADFASRTFEQILPALRAGAIVLADRYVYTAYARDAVRGVDPGWLRKLYSFAVQPTMALYFDVPLDEAIRRIESGRDEIKFYEAGMDLGLAPDPASSFRIFQGRIKQEYEKIVTEFGLWRIDATDPLARQQQLVRKLVQPHLAGARKLNGSDIHAALVETGLSGRYLSDDSGKPIE
jgi:dTMP kinase